MRVPVRKTGARSSEEISVMEMERRDLVWLFVNQKWDEQLIKTESLIML